MADKFSLYNVKNHKLHAKQLEHLFTFATGNFCGALSSENPINLQKTVDESSVTYSWGWNSAPVEFVGGGVSLELSSAGTENRSIQLSTVSTNDVFNALFYIKCDLTADTSNISTDESGAVSLQCITDKENKIPGATVDTSLIIQQTTRDITISQSSSDYAKTSGLVESAVGDGTSTEFPIMYSSSDVSLLKVTVDGEDTSATLQDNKVVFNPAPDDGAVIKIAYKFINDPVVTDELDCFTISMSNPYNDNNISTFDYISNTLWLKEDEVFIIPLVVFIGNENVDKVKFLQLLQYIDVNDIKRFLSADLFYKLKKYVEDNFTWRSGGKVTANPFNPSGSGKGTVGDLNVTGHVLSNIKTDLNERRRKATNKESVLTLDFRHIYFSDLDTFNDQNISSTDIPEPRQAKKDDYALFIRYYPKSEALNESTYSPYNGKLVQAALPVSAGGTGAHNREAGKKNLGITYGKSKPLNNSEKYQNGDIYFQIVE